MKILFLMTFGTALLAYLAERYTRNKRKDIFYIAIVVLLSLFVGLRSSYNDTYSYILSFRYAVPLKQFVTNPDKMHLLHNPLFYGTVSFFREITDNYHVFFMVVAIFNAILMVRFIHEYCEGYFAYAIFLYWGYGLGVFGLAAMKQITAMAILTLAIPALIDKKWGKFITIVFIATLIHTYALLFLLLPIFNSKPWDIKMMCMAVITGIIMLTFNSTISGLLEYADSAGKSIAAEEVFDGWQMNGIRVIVFAVVPVLLLAFRKQLVPEMSRKQQIMGNMSIVCLMFMMLASVNGANLFGRAATYFVYGDICLLGWIIKRLFKKRSQRLAFFFAFLIFVGFLWYDNADFGAQYRMISLYNFFKGLF